MRHLIFLVVFALSVYCLGVLAFAPSDGETSFQSSPSPSPPQPSVSSDDTPQVARMLQEKVRLMAESTLAGRYEVLIENTHPKILQLMGGREQASTVIRAEMTSLGVAGIALKSISFHEEPVFCSANDQWFAVVPVTTVLEIDGHSVEDVRYYLAIKDNSVTPWKFVDASKQSTSTIQAIFPNFPTTVQLPRCTSRILR